MTHNIDRQTAVTVAKEVEAAVAAVFAGHGLAAPKVKTSYGDILRLTIETSVKTEGDNGVNTTSKEAIAYKVMGSLYGLPEDALGVVFTSGGKRYVFTGIATNRPKYPICGTGEDGRSYKFTETTARAIHAAVAAKTTVPVGVAG